MVSLLDLAEITEEGVKFQAPHDKSVMMLTPEKSIHIQNAIGSIVSSDCTVGSLFHCHNFPK